MGRLVIMYALFFAAEVAMGRSIPESGYSNDDGVVRVSVFMDLAQEKNIKFPEGTAMLRANRLLHRACPELPAKYSVAGRVLTNSHNRVEKTYSYVVEYDPESIDAVIRQAKIDAEEALKAERLAAEKATAESSAAKEPEQPVEAVADVQSVKENEGQAEVQPPPVQLEELTKEDIKEKIVEPKVTEENGFKQVVDVDSFGGIDPMEE